MNRKFWNVSRSATGRYMIDLFGYVGGSKDSWLIEGFNENEFLDEFRQIPSDAPIDLTINSTGGLVYTALSIYSRQRRGDVGGHDHHVFAQCPRSDASGVDHDDPSRVVRSCRQC